MTAAPRWSGALGQRRRPISRDATSGPTALPQRDHEMTRLRAKLMNPEAAYADLIERLNYAVVQAGKPSLSALGKQVDYSKATLSKVLTGKAMPSWVLVRRLAEHFQVPPAVVQEWYTLWTAANMHGRRAVPTRVQEIAPSPAAEPAHRCPHCGNWVVEQTALLQNPA
ncbi:helix-turn-helix domain-containing protein [Actinoplanes sp. CA-030573]|uniref:helix-turn-helix domain-containing protein n=1 Tax=Actinoplanes sp. CA-030573 TaxID=3239898 RepID=UPI003D8B4910